MDKVELKIGVSWEEENQNGDFIKQTIFVEKIEDLESVKLTGNTIDGNWIDLYLVRNGKYTLIFNDVGMYDSFLHTIQKIIQVLESGEDSGKDIINFKIEFLEEKAFKIEIENLEFTFKKSDFYLKISKILPLYTHIKDDLNLKCNARNIGED